MNGLDARRMATVHKPLIALALAAVTPLAACARNEPSGAPKSNPVKAVKEFLTDASVQITKNGDSARFELARATRSEQEQFLAPDTEWQIAGGGLRVIPQERL
jgi:hypothetical protein